MADTLPILQPGQNEYGEEDPRLIDQGPAPMSHNQKLTDMAEEVRAERRLVPSPDQIEATGASLEDILTELWTEAYKERIEPSDPTSLAQMSAMRRAKVLEWRRKFLDKKIPMWRQQQNAKREAAISLQDIWIDILDIQRG